MATGSAAGLTAKKKQGRLFIHPAPCHQPRPARLVARVGLLTSTTMQDPTAFMLLR